MLLITPSEVVNYAFTPREEISPQVIKAAKIDVVSDHFVRPRFGDNLFERFEAGDHESFVDSFLKPALAHYVRYAIIDELSIHMSDNGAVIFENEGLQSKHSKQSSLQKVDDSTSSVSDMMVSRVDDDTTTGVEKESLREVAKESRETSTIDETDQTTVEKLTKEAASTVMTITEESNTVVDQNLNSTLMSTVSDTETLSVEQQQSVHKIGSENRTTESLKELAEKSDSTSQSDGETSTERCKSRPATDFERRVVRARALSDANILLAKAVRHVERNLDMFPEYEPLPRSFGRLVL